MKDAGIRQRIRAGEACGVWLSLPSPDVAEVVAGGDAGFVVIDTEHAPTTLETVEAMARAVEAAPGETVPFARTPWNDHVRIKRLLDTGVAGLIAPQVDTADAAASFVDATRYPPAGRRGLAAGRAADYGRSVTEYYETADDRLTRIVQIESPEAVENVEAISATDGIDSVFVGPADLSASLDVFGDYRDPAFRDAVERVVADSACPVGTLATSPELLDYWTELGFDYLIVGTDAGFLTGGLDRRLDRLDELAD